ncbi:MAG: hypothetical protein WCQ47_02485 [bacterium]
MVVLFIAHLIYIRGSNYQIRSEELSEAIRSVLFWQHKQTLWGCANIGYYSILLIVYKVFGFTMVMAKHFKLGFYLVSLVCSAIIFYKKFNIKLSVLFLLMIGLSPTLFYFDSMLTPYGIDLLFYPLSLLLLFSFNPIKVVQAHVISFLLWSLIMLACTSYPVFLFYLPFFICYYLYKLLKETSLSSSKEFWFNLVFSFIGFIFPLILFAIYSDNPANVINDPVFQKGLFRGGSGLSSVAVWLEWGIQSLRVFFYDLFRTGISHYFEGQSSDFAYFEYPFILLNIFFILVAIFKRKNRVLALMIVISLLLGVIILCSTVGVQGLRRGTFIVSFFYTLFFISADSFLSKEMGFKDVKIIIISFLSFCIIVHNAVTIYYNYQLPISDVYIYNQQTGERSIYLYDRMYLIDANLTWFNVVPENPQKSLEYWIKQVDSGKAMFLQNACSYSEIYPALADYYWSKGINKEIKGIDLYDESKREIKLSTELWFKQYSARSDYICKSAYEEDL